MKENSTNDNSKVVSSDKDITWVEWLHGPTTAWFILAISLMITFVAWKISNDYAEQRSKERFQFQVAEAQDAILKRFTNYEQVLRGGLGLFKASNAVELQEWKKYIDALEIDKYFPGTLGVGYAKWLKPSQLDSHISEIRSQGFPNFVVKPEGQRDHYSSIIFLEPFNERNQRAFGYDMYSEPVRREAMQRAMDSGKTALSGKVTLVQETNSGVQAGFLIYLPHYSQEVSSLVDRREYFSGVVYSALRIGDLMQGILGIGIPELEFTIMDGTEIKEENFLYDTQSHSEIVSLESQSRYNLVNTFEIGGHKWTVLYRSNSVFEQATASSQPTLVAVGGVVIDFLLFNVILALGRSKKRAQALADFRMNKLSERERQFKAITDNANDGIISIDENSIIIYVNKSIENMFGFNSGELIGSPLTKLFPSIDDYHLNEMILEEDSKSNSSNTLLEIDGLHSDGVIFPLEFSLARWRVEDVEHASVIVRDITERRRVDRIKSEFISTVSHELRTPLTAISGSLKLVESGVTGEVGEQTHNLINNANRNALRLSKLVNDLLDTEKMASGKMRYDMECCDIATLINKAIEINHSVAEQADVALSFSFTDAIPVYVNVDPDRFIQVMTNLLSNAIKFSPTSSVVDINLSVIENNVKVAVTDHGCGIPEEFRSQMFNKFAQADSSDTRKHTGTGLGLSIVKFIIDQFRGHIDYTSIPEKETTFFFSLPIVNRDKLTNNQNVA